MNERNSKVLVCMLMQDETLHLFNKVFEPIKNEDCFFVMEDTDVKCIAKCKELGIRHSVIKFDRWYFNQNLRRSSFGEPYDEFTIYKIVEMRNRCMEEAEEYILFVDSDVIIPDNTINILLSENKSDISGWYFFRRTPKTSCVIIPSGKPFISGYAPSGCRLTNLIYLRFEFIPGEYEDYLFSDKVKEIGHNTWVHPDIYCEHIGEFSDEARNYRDAYTQ